MSGFILKIIAVISMVIDHLVYVVFNKFSFMNYIGRLAFPIFAFSITEGYIHTKNLKRYFSRLLIFAFVSQIPYMLFISNLTTRFTLNILFTLSLGLLAITIYDKSKNKFLGLLFVGICGIFAQLLHFDYSWFGIAIIFIFYIFKDKKIYMNLSFCIATFINYFYSYITSNRTEYLFIILFCILSLIPINLYNEKKGKNIKYFFYIFYPLHLIILYLLTII